MMTSDLFRRELAYQTTMVIAQTMLARGLVTDTEFAEIDRQMLAKYNPPIGGLSSPNKKLTR